MMKEMKCNSYQDFKEKKDEVIKLFPETDGYMKTRFYYRGHGFYGWNGLRYFMYEYEMQKVRERGSEKIDWSLFTKSEKDKVSIEHIYLQTSDKACWDRAFSGVDVKKKHILTHSLGNLLPLSISINASLQNDCFSDKKKPVMDNGIKKREGYNNGSHSENEVANYPEWTPEIIKKRGLQLLTFMEERWELTFENEEKNWSFCSLMKKRLTNY